MAVYLELDPWHQVLVNPAAGASNSWDMDSIRGAAVNNNTVYDCLCGFDVQPVSGSSGSYLVGAGRSARIPLSVNVRFSYKLAATTNSSAPVPTGPQIDFFFLPERPEFSDVPIAGVSQPAIVSTGMIVMMARATAPAGWLSCDGSAVSRVTYAALFAVIGTQFGAGDALSTFNLPDLSGSGLQVAGSVIAKYYIAT